MRRIYAGGLFLVAILITDPGLAQQELEELASPHLPPQASSDAREKSREGARLFLEGQCKIYEAMRWLTWRANEAIDDAEKSFRDASNSFRQAARILREQNNGLVLSISEEDPRVAKALTILRREGIEPPRSFAEAMDRLTDASNEAARELAAMGYGSTREQRIEILERLRVTAGKAANVFVAITILTVLGAVG